MDHVNPTSLTVAHFVTCWPAPRLTVIAKASLVLRPGAAVTVAKDKATLAGDEPLDGFAQQLRYPSDLVPMKPKADIMLVGTEAARSGQELHVGAHRFAGGGNPQVAPFAALAFDAPSRFAKLGTYDERWLKERWPWFPEDFDASYFNAAAPSLQVEHLHGDEAIALVNVLPGQRLRSQLPGKRMRCFLDEQLEDGPRFREVRLHLDTLWIDAQTESLQLVWRGMVDVTDEDASQVSRVIWAEEALDVVAKPLADYQEQHRVLALEQPAPAEAPPVNDNEPPDDMSEREKAALEELSDRLEALGAPAEMLALVQQAETMDAAMVALGKTVDSDPAKAEAMVAEAEGKLRARLEEAGHELPDDEPAPQTVTMPAPWTRERVQLAVEHGESMAGVDLSQLDLSELDLGGAQLQGALLRGTKLTRSKLYAADLSDAILTGADLEGASLGTAKLTDANLHAVSAPRADFRRAELTGAALDESMLEGALFDDAVADGASFRRAKLSGAQFRGTALTSARFVETVLHDATFEGANLAGATLKGGRGEQVCFRNADLTNLRAGDGAHWAKADMSGATADRSVWMGADLQGAKMVGMRLCRADLSATSLNAADLSGSDCQNADFTKSDLEGAQLVQANFAGARFTSAKLDRADARNANFFEAELWKASRRGLLLDGAHVASSKLVEVSHV